MVDFGDDAKGGGYRRIEVLTGPGRRRKWSDDEKARIVAETLQPGAVVTAVARRWQVCPQQVFGWRREMRLGTSGGSVAAQDFVPIVAVPADGVTRPSSILSVVDFPAPLGPRKPVTAPSRAVQLRSSTALTSPNRFDSP